MKLTLRPAEKFVLAIGDEGVVLTLVVGHGVRGRWFSPSTKSTDTDQLSEALARSRTTPVYPLIDVLEQSYTRDDIPPVSMLDTARLIQRKLVTAFPNDRIRGSLYLGRDSTTERSDKRYLLAGLPDTPALVSWMSWLNARDNPIKPLSLLPLEAVCLAESLSRQLCNDHDFPHWTMLVTRHRTGGFRQIVARDGEFVFTRLTPDLPGDASAFDVASAIRHEYETSMSYMRRVSYSDDQRMALIVIGMPDIGQALLDAGIPEARLKSITPSVAAERLGLTGVAEVDDPYGETLHSTAFAQKRRPIMRLMPQELYEKRAGTMATRAAYCAIAIAVGFASFGLSDTYLASQDIGRTFDQASLQTLQHEAKLSSVMSETDGGHAAAPQISDTIVLYDRLATEAPSPLPLLAMIGPALGPDVIVHRIDWDVEHEANGTNVSLALTVRIETLSDSIEVAVNAANALAARVAERFPGLDVSVSDPPVDTLADQTLSGEVELMDDDEGITTNSYDATISIHVPTGWPPDRSS